MDTQDQPHLVDGLPEVDEAFASSLDFERIVDPANWQPPGEYYQQMPAATRAVVSRVVDADEHLRQELRERYLPELLRNGTLKCWERANQNYIELLQRKRLYSGQVVA